MSFYFGAGGENRTRITCLEGTYISHYTTPACFIYFNRCSEKFNRYHGAVYNKNITIMKNDPFHRDPPKPFHSSGYAEVARGNTIGSTNSQTFGQRVHVERNRSAVARYGNSHIGQGYIHQSVTPRTGLRSQTPRTTAPDPRGHASMPMRPMAGLQTPRTTFREPPSRYNPYG